MSEFKKIRRADFGENLVKSRRKMEDQKEIRDRWMLRKDYKHVIFGNFRLTDGLGFRV